MRSLLIAAALFLPLSAYAEVKVVEPWIPEAPPNAQALGAFMVLENDEDREVKVVSAWAPGFDTIELHKSVEENGMHKMIKQDALVIPPMGSLELRPGSYHVMLIGVHKPPKAGDVIPLRLDFEGLPSQTIQVPVKKRAEMMKRMAPMQGH
ncbi:copper chaperone PCu(A)C [Thiofaba sp. EF100]|uniref:copper chaperone PCu(A)C n=1 Tax=Thiofaba sp. EF100 TaxID=3121274 RepID=UPI0032213FA8